jgi:hypothetical protein
MAERGVLTAGEDGRRGALQRGYGWSADGVDAGVDAVQPTARCAPVDRPGAETELEQLCLG